MTSDLLADRHPADPLPLGASRERVLRVLQATRAALGVGDVADRVHLHPNTTRFHLDALVEAGLALRTREEREVPGRPRTLYLASPDSTRTGRRNYRLLAEILSGYLANHTRQRAQAALKAGEDWGRDLVERRGTVRRIGAAAATRHLVDALEEIGFAPEAVIAGRTRTVLLRHCPFREAAEEHPEIVCSIHLGLMRGLLAELQAPLEAERLDPFVEPGLCVTQLAIASKRR